MSLCKTLVFSSKSLFRASLLVAGREPADSRDLKDAYAYFQLGESSQALVNVPIVSLQQCIGT